MIAEVRTGDTIELRYPGWPAPDMTLRVDLLIRSVKHGTAVIETERAWIVERIVESVEHELTEA